MTEPKLLAALIALTSIREELDDLLTGECEGGHPDIDDITRRDLASIRRTAAAAILEASNASAAQRPPDSSVAETPEEEH